MKLSIWEYIISYFQMENFSYNMFIFYVVFA